MKVFNEEIIVKKILITGGSGFIGCNLIEYLLTNNYDILNLDIHKPRNSKLNDYWVYCDILDYANLKLNTQEFSPNYVIHLAARTDLRGNTICDYRSNTQGTENLINVLDEINNLKKVLFASSRLVCEIEHKPLVYDDYSATTPYGKSKVYLEKYVREKCHDVHYDWIIFRPTSIWGPWFDEPYRDFFNAVLNGSYVHPNGMEIYKSFGYVGNSVFLLEKMLSSDKKLDKKTIYLSDYESLNVLEWANAIRSKNGLSSIKKIPLVLLRLVAYFGTFLDRVGLKRVPLTKFRLNNLITSTNYDVEPLKEFSKDLPYNMHQGVDTTLSWINKK